MRTQTVSSESSEIQTLLNAFPKEFVEISPREQGVAIALYRLLAMGRPVSHQQLADANAVPLAEVDHLLNKWIAVYHNDSGSVTGFWGLTLDETPHKLLIGGQKLYAWCAWDTLFLPTLVGMPGQIVSYCAVSGTKIQLSIDHKHIQSFAPEDTVLSFVLPNEGGIRKDVINSFCHSVLFFASSEYGEQWLAKHPESFLMPLSDAFDLAQRFNQGKFPGLM